MAQADVMRNNSPDQEKLQQEMLDRMVGTFEAARSKQQDSPRLDERMRVVAEQSRLFYKYVIPNWPLKMLVRKITRRLVMPILAPQVEFNEAVRDVLLEMRQRYETQSAAHREALHLVQELEAQVENLTEQVALLSARQNTSPVSSHTNGLGKL